MVASRGGRYVLANTMTIKFKVEGGRAPGEFTAKKASEIKNS